MKAFLVKGNFETAVYSEWDTVVIAKDIAEAAKLAKAYEFSDKIITKPVNLTIRSIEQIASNVIISSEVKENPTSKHLSR